MPADALRLKERGNDGEAFRLPPGQAEAATEKKNAAPPAGTFRPSALLNPNCIVCGARNPKGLQLEFHIGAVGVDATWVPGAEWESFRGTVHGGIVTAVLDEAMSRAVIARNWQALTVDLRVRFRARVMPEEKLHVHGWVVGRHKRKVVTEATLVTANGVERAHGWGVFLIPRPGMIT